MRFASLFIGLLLVFLACTKDYEDPEVYKLSIPYGFPQPVFPADNELTQSRVALGKKLFYDPVMSRDSTRSCGSCHFPHLAFSDSVALSPGVEDRPANRNAPSLANVIYQEKLLREGGLPSLEMQVLVPVQEHNEFDYSLIFIAQRLLRNQEYVELSQKAYGRAPDPYVITRAIAAFERTFISGGSPFDQWYFQGKKETINREAVRGFALFQSERLGCNQCHNGFLFTNQSFANNGLYEDYNDPGRYRFTGLESDRAVFKIPSLRNIALTSPYMFDGSLPTLDAVIDHYQTGGKAHPNKSTLIKPFQLTPQERSELLAFLHSLTDEQFVNDPAFRQDL